MNLSSLYKEIIPFNRTLESIDCKGIGMSSIEIRMKIQEIEDMMQEMPEHTIGDVCPLRHNFGKGLYVREITMPPGFLSTTKIHKHAHPAFILKGIVSIFEESGFKVIKAPAYFITKEGTKRIIYCHTEVIWVTVHATESTNIDKIESEIIAKSFQEMGDLS